MLLLDFGAGGDFKSATHFGVSKLFDILTKVRVFSKVCLVCIFDFRRMRGEIRVSLLKLRGRC